jgi:hypothetical protein
MANDEQLKRIAKELFWWQPPEISLANSRRFLAQVMSLGTWEQLQEVKRQFGWESFQDALVNAEAGWFDPRSWALWHHAFGLPIKPMPKRSLT